MKKFIFFLIFAYSLAFANQGEQFLSRTFIDTTVQGAFNAFVVASRDAGGLTQERAVHNAREIVNDLRRMAETDPNRRYILWRVSELEAQISLEEEEMNFRRRYAQVQQINELVDIFNRELLVPRPSFANLQQLHLRMSAIDVRTTNQFADRINQKMRSVTHNLTADITNAFNRNNYAQAEVEFLYAIENRRFLRISNAELERWRLRIQARRDADYLQANLGVRITFVTDIMRENRLLEARRHIEVLTNDLERATSLLPRAFVNATRTQLREATNTINRREDFLLQHGNALVEGRAFDEAQHFLRTVLIPAGVSRDRISEIDRAIIAARGATQPTNRAEIRSFDMLDEGSGDIMQERMRARADSIRIIHRQEEERAIAHFQRLNRREIQRHDTAEQRRMQSQLQSDDFLRSVRNSFIQGNPEAGARLFRGRRAQDAFANADPLLFIEVKILLNNFTGTNSDSDPQIIVARRRVEANSPAVQRQRAQNITAEIRRSLEAGQARDAFRIYYFNRNLLEEFSSPATLRRALVQAYLRDVM